MKNETVTAAGSTYEVLSSKNAIGGKGNAYRSLYVAKLRGEKVYSAVIHPGCEMKVLSWDGLTRADLNGLPRRQ